MTQRYERLAWNPKTGNSIKNKLLAASLVVFEVIAVPNSRVKLLSLTEKGLAYAQEQGIAVGSIGRAGLAHEFWRNRIRERCEARGYSVTSEYHLGGGKHVDLQATKGSTTVLIEIETGLATDPGRTVKQKCTASPRD